MPMNKTITETALQLQESYAKDREPFATRAKRYPERPGKAPEIASLERILFPLYWNAEELTVDSEALVAQLHEFAKVLQHGIEAESLNEATALATAKSLLSSLPLIREQLKKDAEAAFAGDPAAGDHVQIIRSYPGFAAVLVQRFAHLLYTERITSYARELTEIAHSATGIDIHPGARIGSNFFIDHGTGVVIGETAQIGSYVRIYQGVTLGALHFMKGDGGVLRKGYKRHPTIGDSVVVGAGAKILGPVTIASNVSIGANAWIEEDIPPNTSVFIAEHPKLLRKEKLG